MPGGRPPKPTNLKIITGTARPDRINQDEPQPPAGSDVAPIWVKGRARRVWHWIAPRLLDLRILTEADQESLGLGCDALADYLECREIIRKEGRTYTTTTMQGDTMIRPRPEVAMASDAWRRAEHILSAFGLNPSARSRVKVSAEEETDPMEAFLSRGRPD